MDNSTVYWGDDLTGQISSVSKNPGGAVTHYSINMPMGGDIVQDNASLYFIGAATAPGGFVDEHSIYKMSKVGGLAVTIGDHHSYGGSLTTGPAGGILYYWSGFRDIPKDPNDTSTYGTRVLASLSTLGGSETVLVWDENGNLANAAMDKAGLNHRQSPSFESPSTDSTYLYWSDSSRIWQMPLVGVSPSAIVSGRTGIRVIATPTTGAAAGSIFWTEGNGTSYTLMRRKVGGQIITVLTNITTSDRCFAVDDDKVFSEQGGGLVQVSIDGGTATVLADITQAFGPVGVAMDSTYVYWGNLIGQILRIARPGGSVNYTMTASASPAAGGTISGGGTFGSGASVTLVATPNGGYSFVNWTEGGSQVSATASYNFAASGSRTLVANFTVTPITCTITTSALPAGGGTTSGDGTFNAGTSVTVVAAPNGSYSFVNWTEGGSPVNATASYNFTAGVSRTLMANFTLSSSNANLASLVPSTGILSPAFASGTTSYTANIAKSALTFKVTPTMAQAGATVKVNGTTVTSGTASGPIALSIGSNTITTVVTAPDAVTTQTYTLTVTRASRDMLRDLNGDGNADLIFQNNVGQIARWYMNGSGSTTSSGYLYSSGLGDWKVKGIADMNGDGNADIIFQNNVGQIAVWYRDGSGTVTSSVYLYSGGLGDWRVVGVADVNGDGNADLLFQNNVGQIAVWYRDGSGTVTSSVYLSTGALGDWRVVGVTDVNGDGNTDLLFQNNVGQIAVWYRDGSGAVTSSVYLYSSGLGDWRVVGIADMNGDGNADLLFQNNAGQISVWYRDGSGAVTSSVYLYSGGLGDWRVR